MVQAVIENAEMSGWLDDLVLACSEARPGYANFAELIADLGLGVGMESEDRQALERFYKDDGSLLDWAVVGGLIKKVCQINYKTNAGKTVNGTGFLLGPDVVMTNFHVVEKIVKDEAANFSDVNVKFDYKLNEDGSTLNEGVTHKLAAAPLLDHATYSAKDEVASDVAPATGDEELDYALMRLDTPAGCLPVQSKAGTDDVATADNRRGWIDLEANPLIPGKDAPITIVQHPAGGVVKVAHESNSVIESNPNDTRVRHRTATLGGSSGAPCFDIRWKLVGLHNGTDPDLGRAATYNQFVPLKAIRAMLQQRGKLDLLSRPCE
jgi:V8-like Glu-specific endopeptidase